MSTSVPSLHVSSGSKASGSIKVLIQSRTDAVHSGVFSVKGSVSFDPTSPTDDYPTGSIRIIADLSDSLAATFLSTSIELVNSFGKHNPTIIFTGRCSVRPANPTQGNEEPPRGCKYWIIIANNKQSQEQVLAPERVTPDIVGFVITDRAGNRVAYGTGPVVSGDFDVSPA